MVLAVPSAHVQTLKGPNGRFEIEGQIWGPRGKFLFLMIAHIQGYNGSKFDEF